MGIDPGVANTGFGVVRLAGGQMTAVDGGVIEAPADAPLESRLASIHAELEKLIAWHEPAALALEDLYFNKNARSATAVGQARGVAMLAAGQRAIPCFDYTPQAVKMAVCGSGAADKRQVAGHGRRAARARAALRSPTTRPTRSQLQSATPAGRSWRARSRPPSSARRRSHDRLGPRRGAGPPSRSRRDRVRGGRLSAHGLVGDAQGRARERQGGGAAQPPRRPRRRPVSSTALPPRRSATCSAT